MADLSPEEILQRLYSTRERSNVYGVSTLEPNYGASASRQFVLSGVKEAVDPLLKQQQSGLSARGFGSRYYSPTIEAQAIKPVVGQAAESVRKGLTDLWYKDEELALQKRKMAIEEGTFKLQKKAAKAQESGGKVLCTFLYRMGLLPFAHIISDYKFLKRNVDKETHDNYLRWAVPLVGFLEHNKMFVYAIYPFVYMWSCYMRAIVNHKRVPMSGFLVHKFGIAFGKFYKRLKLKQSLKKAVI